MNDDIKNLVFAIVLSTIVLVGWQYFFEMPRQEAMQAAQQKVQQDAIPPKIEAPIGAAETSVSVVPTSREDAIKAVPRIKIESATLSGSISLKGARFDDLILKEFKKELNKQNGFVEMLSPSNTGDVYFADFGWATSDKNIVVPDSQVVWSANLNTLTPQNPVTLVWDNGQGLRFFRKIELDEHFMLTVTQSVENHGTQSVVIAPYGLINRTKETYTDFLISHEGVLGVFNDILFEELSYNEMLDEMKPGEKKKFADSKGWLGMADKYWLTVIAPADNENFTVYFSYNLVNERPRYQAEFIGKAKTIEPGQKIASKQYFFAGAKKVDLLDQYAKNLGINLFDRAVDFGWFYFLTKPIFLSLKYFYGFLGNFGLAILLLTVCIKLLLFPVANKGYVSMNRLKELQPKVIELRDRFKDDKVKLQQEMMALYKREKVNPMSGCLPILIQIPIFFSLYKVLFISIEMRHAPFYGWIHDLSASDPTTVFNLFGLLPFTPPSFLMIGAWPCIMMVTMIIQQKLNPPPPDPVQASMIKALPYIFVFLFAHFPAGLIIYWSWSNFLSILQQWVIAKILPARREAKGKARF